ncbi:rRNA maturation RNase YbeY [Adhaeribacter pallidiroseus]|uniref:Endoribonuclease YbeY n=1 Tax=Adhaeribacter pallidiroseus TaxID=2072847 RepID=A0A369QL69_9BACT|nr:rRNA maturation RNase YbeY [Adhaeribacter pallidiroseus]RDC65673.1 Endoribonuclease YbeY [Adhaeribacter pallidiroseus]
MPDLPIEFIAEDIPFTIPDENKLKDWIARVINFYEFNLENLTFIFCYDDYLLDINKSYLNHDTLTDIITFDNSDEEQTIEGDIFISIDRVKENAINFNVLLLEELHRVIIHGVLHLIGYDDKTESNKTEMRQKEDYWLSLRDFTTDGI